MEWTATGPHAALLSIDAADEVARHRRSAAIQRFLEAERPPEIVDFAIAFDRLLLEFPPGEDPSVLAARWADRLAALPDLAPDLATLHEITVSYDGPDLVELATRHGLSVAEVVELHTAPIYDVALIGFSPGFPYLAGLDPRLHTPRRAVPRSRVPSGAVAIGGSHTGIYSVETPGGWHILGTTDTRLFDPTREGEAMFLLRTGDRVRFVAAD